MAHYAVALTRFDSHIVFQYSSCRHGIAVSKRYERVAHIIFSRSGIFKRDVPTFLTRPGPFRRESQAVRDSWLSFHSMCENAKGMNVAHFAKG